ncbi:hypothetical protein O6H91_18G054400 [Diphasiastrum complanatum]|uniref:Uncharacterized protein n=1 Tax=Diphasiastrum complanatum TaxID=34168 RepID=A0ACC2B1G6_DIPCM|nr:hypothetical protein O6H91_18G054400 [Diphasiastrum complanatum]
MANRSYSDCTNGVPVFSSLSSEAMGSCGPRISLSEGLICVESDSVEGAAQASGLTGSSDFEFFLSFEAVPDAGCSPSQSMCSADKLFSNGQILPLDQVQVSQADSPKDKLKQLPIADHVSSEIGPASISRCWTDMFKMKRPAHTDCPAAASSKEKQLFGARSLWFLRKSRSTNDHKSPDPYMPNADPWLGRSASDSRINRFLPPSAGPLSRKGCAKRTSNASADKHYEAFKSYSQVRSQSNSCNNVKENLRNLPDMAAVPKCKAKGMRMSSPGRTSSGNKRASVSAQRRASDAVEGRAAANRLDNDITDKPAHPRSASKALDIDQGIDMSQKRREFPRPRSQKQHEHWRSSSRGRSYQVAPVLNMQMCMGQSFMTSKASKARLVEFCNLTFLKKDKVRKQHMGDAAIDPIS